MLVELGGLHETPRVSSSVVIAVVGQWQIIVGGEGLCLGLGGHSDWNPSHEYDPSRFQLDCVCGRIYNSVADHKLIDCDR